MRTKKFIRNTIFSGILFTVAFLTGIFLPKLYLTYFGNEINGLIGSLTSFISYFILIESGFRGAATYKLYKPVASNDKAEIDGLMSKTKHTYNIFALIYLLFTLAFAIIFPFVVNVEGVDSWQLFLLAVILGMPTFIDFLIYQKYYILFAVNQKVYVPSIAQTIEKIVTFLMILFLTPLLVRHLSLSTALIVLKASLVFIYFLKIMVLRRLIKREWSFISFKQDHNDIKIPNQGYTLLNAAVGKMQTTVPTMIATFVLTFSDVSIIQVYSAVILGISGIINIFRSGVDAGFGELIARGETNNLSNAFAEFQLLFYTIVVLVNILIASLLPTFMNIYIGINEGVNYVLPSFALIYTAMSFITDLRIPHVMLLNSAGKYKERAKVNIAYAVIVIPITLLFGFIGRHFSLGLELIMVSMILFNIVRLVEHLRISKTIMTDKAKYSRQNLKLILATVLLFVILTIPHYVLINTTLNLVNSYLKWVIYAIITGSVYLPLTVFIFYLLDKHSFNKLLRRFIKKKPRKESV